VFAGPDWQEKIEVILDSIREGLLAVDGAGKINLANKAAEKLTGIPAGELINRQVEQVVPNTRLHIVLQTGKPEMNKRQQLGSTTILTNRLPVHDRYGNILGAVAVFRDITEVIQLAEEITSLKETRTMLQEIINSTQDAISVVDENGIGILINTAYTNLTGLSSQEVLNRPATVDIAEGESVHMEVLQSRRPIKGRLMKVGPRRKEVVVDAAPIIVNDIIKGSVAVIHDVSQIHRLSRELEGARQLIRRLEAKYSFKDIVGSGPEIKKVINDAAQAARTPATVILSGESGTGKELFAHAIHQASGRKGRFVRVNCAAIPESLMESEFFGYAEGAFTGAKTGGKRGYFEEAEGGTIFLDEIAEIATEVQARLLRVLQEKEIMRVGSNVPVPVDVRVIAATNIDLEQLVHEERFRSDLYYRLSMMPIRVPALRERKEDIPQLTAFIIIKLNREFGRNVTGVSPEVLGALERYNWPGNVRELENVLGRAMINMQPSEMRVELQHLPFLTSGYSSPLPAGHHSGDWEYSGESFQDLNTTTQFKNLVDIENKICYG